MKKKKKVSAKNGLTKKGGLKKPKTKQEKTESKDNNFLFKWLFVWN